MPDIDPQIYSNIANVWGYDELTRLIQERVENMPDLPKRVAILVSQTNSDDASIHANFGRFEAYDNFALEWLGNSFRLFFFALAPDSAMNGDDFLDTLAKTSFVEGFLLYGGQAVTRLAKLESLEEAQRKYNEQNENLLRQFLPPVGE